MNNSEKQRLEVERAIGGQHEQVWANTVEPFFLHKEKQLFDAFCNCPSNNKELLLDIKLQQNALNGLKEHFISFIETGKMASLQLDELEKGE